MTQDFRKNRFTDDTPGIFLCMIDSLVYNGHSDAVLQSTARNTD